jgi:hypothetical protein
MKTENAALRERIDGLEAMLREILEDAYEDFDGQDDLNHVHVAVLDRARALLLGAPGLYASDGESGVWHDGQFFSAGQMPITISVSNNDHEDDGA